MSALAGLNPTVLLALILRGFVGDHARPQSQGESADESESTDVNVICEPESLAGLLVLMVGEAIIGLTLGLGVMILFSGMQIAGQIIGQMSGIMSSPGGRAWWARARGLFNQELQHHVDNELIVAEEGR